MLDLQDIQKLTEVLANKTDVKEVKDQLSELKIITSSLVSVVDGQ